MRIISQDGFYDVPYEAIAIRFHEDDRTIIIGVPLSYISIDLVSDVAVITLGEYSSKAKAQKAMEMLHEKYKYYVETTNNIDFYTMFDCPKVFQFPADEDVEE